LSRLAFSVLGGGWAAAAATTGTGMKTGTAMTGSPCQNQGIFLGCQFILSFLRFIFYLFLSKLVNFRMQTTSNVKLSDFFFKYRKLSSLHVQSDK
jgi:hypothetical protein